jgi:hypothetical protein
METDVEKKKLVVIQNIDRSKDRPKVNSKSNGHNLNLVIQLHSDSLAGSCSIDPVVTLSVSDGSRL